MCERLLQQFVRCRGLSEFCFSYLLSVNPVERISVKTFSITVRVLRETV